MNPFFNNFINLSVSIAIFALFVVMLRLIMGKVRNSSLGYLNPTAFLPEEELKALKQSITC